MCDANVNIRLERKIHHTQPVPLLDRLRALELAALEFIEF